MSRTYSLDLRQRNVNAITQGATRRATQRQWQIGPLVGCYYHQRKGETGRNHARPGGMAGKE